MDGSTAFIDGISSVASHNGIHRVMCYSLDGEGKPEKSVELIIPHASLFSVRDALAKLAGAEGDRLRRPIPEARPRGRVFRSEAAYFGHRF
jgi:hypothetical protein